MKKIFLYLIIIIFSLSLVGCGKKDYKQTTTDENNSVIKNEKNDTQNEESNTDEPIIKDNTINSTNSNVNSDKTKNNTSRSNSSDKSEKNNDIHNNKENYNLNNNDNTSSSNANNKTENSSDEEKSPINQININSNDHIQDNESNKNNEINKNDKKNYVYVHDAILVKYCKNGYKEINDYCYKTTTPTKQYGCSESLINNMWL